MGKAAGLSCHLEQNPTTAVDTNIAPADVLFENFDDNGSLAIDVNIVSPFRTGSLSGGSQTYLKTSNDAFVTKMNKYAEYTFKERHYFIPFVMEEFGGMHKQAMFIFNRLCTFIANRQDKDVTEVKFHYSKLLSSTIKRHNSRAILVRKS